MDFVDIPCSHRNGQVSCISMSQYTSETMLGVKLILDITLKLRHTFKEHKFDDFTEIFSLISGRGGKRGRRAKISQFSQVELEYEMEPLDRIEMEKEYIDVIVYFGFCLMFYTVSPRMAAMAMVGIFTSQFFLGYHLKHLKRRPEPQTRAGLGLKINLLYYLAFLGIMVNTAVALLQFQLDYAIPPWVGKYFEPRDADYRSSDNSTFENESQSQYWFFVFTEHIFLLIFFSVEYYNRQAPVELDMIKRRGEFLRDYVLNASADLEVDESSTERMESREQQSSSNSFRPEIGFDDNDER